MGEGLCLIIEAVIRIHKLVPQECATQIVPESPRSPDNYASIEELLFEVGVVGVPCWEGDLWIYQWNFWEKLCLIRVRELELVTTEDDICLEGLKGLPEISPARQEDCVFGVCPYNKLVIWDVPAQAGIVCCCNTPLLST